MNNKNKNQPTKSANFLPGFKTQDDLKSFKDAWGKVTAETTGGLLNPNNGTFEEVVDIKGNAHIDPPIAGELKIKQQKLGVRGLPGECRKRKGPRCLHITGP